MVWDTDAYINEQAPWKLAKTDTEGARVLGQILAREGDLDGAHELLLPYMSSKLQLLAGTLVPDAGSVRIAGITGASCRSASSR